MYIGRHPRSITGEALTEEAVAIPENYAGNAFSEVTSARGAILEEDPKWTREENESEDGDACEQASKPSGGLSFFEKLAPHVEQLFSSDALLVFLAVLLSQSDDGSELGLLLFLLLLF